MAEFFRTLAAQTLGRGPRLEPLRPSRYEAAPEITEIFEEIETLEVEAPSSPDAVRQEPPTPAAPRAAVSPQGMDTPLVEVVRGEPRVVAPPSDVTDDPLAEPALETPPAPAPPARTATVTRSIVRATASPLPTSRESITKERIPIRHRQVTSGFAAREEPMTQEIVVRIGRVDVRAIVPPVAPPPPGPSVKPRRTAPTLEDHLRKRGADLQ